MRWLCFTVPAALCLVAGCTSSTSPSGSEPTSQATLSATAAWLAIAHDARNRTEVQLRDLRDGRVLRTLTTAGPDESVSVARFPDADVLVARTHDCVTTLERIDPLTGRHVQLPSIHGDASGFDIAPDGQHLAYLTHPRCSTDRCPGVCAGPAQFLPNVLVVADLAGGASRRTATDDPGHPLASLSWSPDGRQLVADYLGDTTQLLVFDGRHPDFEHAQRISSRGCGYFAPTWTRAGIVAAHGCGPEAELALTQLVQLSVTGRMTGAHWELPRCIDGLITRNTPAGRTLLVQTDVGYGGGRCGKHWGSQYFEVTPSGLHSILSLPGAAEDVQLAG